MNKRRFVGTLTRIAWRCSTLTLAALWAILVSGCGQMPAHEPVDRVTPVTSSTRVAASESINPSATAGTGETAAAASGPLPASPFPPGLTGVLAFESDAEGRTKIYTLNLSTGRVMRLTEGPQWRDESPRWSPDGARLVFKSNRAHYEGPNPEQGQADYDIYVMNADGSNVRRLTTDAAQEGDPFWMPDGQSVVFSSDRDSRGDLYRLWLNDGRVERLTRHFVGRAIMPNVSPDGGRIAFAAQTFRRGEFWLFQVHVIDVQSNESRPLPQVGGACWPSWSPDGKQLAYVLLDEDPSKLEIVNLETGAKRRIFHDGKLWGYYPEWLGDGGRLVFSVSPEHHDGEDWDLAVLDVARPGAFVRLTTGRGNDRLPDWKP